MDKRYQVFISSTFADLKEERQKVIQTLMEMDCIPAGMELFPAADIEQFEFIKRVIDDCDYYVLIIGGRYGSLSPEGISFTEAEYDYAISKGLKVLAFIHSAPEKLAVERSEKDPDLQSKLDSFRNRVSEGRLVKFWTQTEELPGLVALSMLKTIKLYPSVGWVRGDKAGSSELLEDLNDIRKENEKLKFEIGSLSVSSGKRRVDSFHDLRKRARHRIVVTGIGMTSIVQYDIHSLAQQAENAPIDFLMLDPELLEHDSGFAGRLEAFLNISDFSEKVRSSFDKLRAFCEEWNSKEENRFKMRLRVYDTIPTNSMVVIDPGEDSSEAIIEFFLYQSGTHRPRLHVKGIGSGKEVFDQVWSDFLKLWGASREIA